MSVDKLIKRARAIIAAARESGEPLADPEAAKHTMKAIDKVIAVLGEMRCELATAVFADQCRKENDEQGP
jgi:hypothetical protein